MLIAVRRRVVDVEPVSGAPPEAGPAKSELEALATTERAATDARDLVRTLLEHAELILSRWPKAAEVALRKATRAHAVAVERDETDLVVDALRVRVRIAQAAVGREALASSLARELIGRLEARPEDTRRERASLWATVGRKEWWWYAETRSPRREDCAENEAALRTALGLLMPLGDEASAEIADVAASLLKSLEWCGAREAIHELWRTAPLPPKAIDRLRELGVVVPV